MKVINEILFSQKSKMESLQEIFNRPLLSKGEISSLIQRYKETDNSVLKDSLKEEIFSNYAKYILKLSKRFSFMYFSLEDAFQQGTIGFLEALERFDSKKNVRFITFLHFYLLKNLLNKNENNIIKIPCSSISGNVGDLAHYRKIESGYDKKDEKFLNKEKFKNPKLFEKLKKRFHHIYKIIRIIRLEDPLYDNKSKTEVFNYEKFIKDERPLHDSIIIKKDLLQKIKRISVKKLNKIERKVIILRYLREKTLDEVKNLIKRRKGNFNKKELSKQRIEQIEKQALKKIKRSLNSNNLLNRRKNVLL